MRGLLVLVCICTTVSGTAHAQTPWQFWPEASLFIKLSPTTRILLDVPYATDMEPGQGALDLAAYLDVSLRPIGRPALQKLDWQRSRFFWTRIGYARLLETGGGARAVSENRGILALLGKVGLPAEIWLESRVRADLRWIGGEHSTRYRFRIEATREFTVVHHSVVPYFNVEWFYDTRYNGWARTLYQLGSEFTVSNHFRFELLLARQNDHLPVASSLNAFGTVAKWYY